MKTLFVLLCLAIFCNATTQNVLPEKTSVSEIFYGMGNLTKLSQGACPGNASYNMRLQSTRDYIKAALTKMGYTVWTSKGQYQSLFAGMHFEQAPEQKTFIAMAHYRPRCETPASPDWSTRDHGVNDNLSGVVGVLELARVTALGTMASGKPIVMTPQNRAASRRSVLFAFFDDRCGYVFPNASKEWVANGGVGDFAVTNGVDFDEISNYNPDPNTSGWNLALSAVFPSTGLKEVANHYRANWIGGFGTSEVATEAKLFGNIVSQQVPDLRYYDLTTLMSHTLECNHLNPLKNFCMSDAGNFWAKELPVVELTDMSPLRKLGPFNSDLYYQRMVFMSKIIKASLYYLDHFLAATQ